MELTESRHCFKKRLVILKTAIETIRDETQRERGKRTEYRMCGSTAVSAGEEQGGKKCSRFHEIQWKCTPNSIKTTCNSRNSLNIHR